MRFNWYFWLAAAVVVANSAFGANLSQPAASIQHWSKLSMPHPLYPHGSGAIYYSFDLSNGSRVHLIVIDMHSGKWSVQPFIADGSTIPASAAVISSGASAGVNGGYFNLKNG